MRVVNMRTSKYDIYIGRGTKWGNPYSHIYGNGEHYVPTREIAVKKYREYILNTPELIKDLHELKGNTLGCFCKPKLCHGDVLIQLIKELGI